MRYVGNDDLNITGVLISKKSKCAEQTAHSKIWKHCKSYIHCVRYVGNDDLNITGVVISKNSKCAEQTANSKSLKTL